MQSGPDSDTIRSKIVADSEPGRLPQAARRADRRGSYPTLRLLALAACGTRTVIDPVFGPTSADETIYAADLLRGLQTGEGARYRRLSHKRGKAKANVALGNAQMRVLHVLPSNPGMRNRDLGPDYYDHDRNTARTLQFSGQF